MFQTELVVCSSNEQYVYGGIRKIVHCLPFRLKISTDVRLKSRVLCHRNNKEKGFSVNHYSVVKWALCHFNYQKSNVCWEACSGHKRKHQSSTLLSNTHYKIIFFEKNKSYCHFIDIGVVEALMKSLWEVDQVALLPHCILYVWQRYR